MSDIINGNNIDDKKEDQNDIKARYFHIIVESGLAEPKITCFLAAFIFILSLYG